MTEKIDGNDTAEQRADADGNADDVDILSSDDEEKGWVFVCHLVSHCFVIIYVSIRVYREFGPIRTMCLMYTQGFLRTHHYYESNVPPLTPTPHLHMFLDVHCIYNNQWQI